MQHDCFSFRDGDWIIYECSECGYRVKENWRTGESLVTNSGNRTVPHYGSYYPKEYSEAFENLN